MSSYTVLVIDDSPTILKVVDLVLTKAGFNVLTASDGEDGLAAARAHKPDLILLDFVMPKMNGYQVCRALAHESELKDTAVVLMSAKGDQVGDRFVNVMGIIDYITKPFSPEAITAVVQHSIEKYVRARPDEHTMPIIQSEITELDQLTAEDAKTRDDQREKARNRAIASVRELLAESITANLTLSNDVGSNEPSLDAVGDAIEAALGDKVLAELAEAIRPLSSFSNEAPSLEGHINVVPIAEVLQLLAQQLQSGILKVFRGDSTVQICFRQGLVDLAMSRNVSDEFLIGRFLVGAQVIDGDDLDGFIAASDESQHLLGNQLVRLGYVTPIQLQSALTEQTRELVYEVLRWSSGDFAFYRTGELPAPASEASLGLDIEGILMEGFRRVDEWHLIEREIDDFDKVFLRNDDAIKHMGRGRLTREERAVLELVNGKNTVKQIIRSSKMGSFDVSKMLYRLLSIKLIRARVQPIAV